MVPRAAALAADEAAQDLAADILATRPAATPLDARRAYRDLLFHGPCYQRIKHISGLDAGGADTRVQPSPAGSFGTHDGWIFDPGLLDAAAQLAWIWSAQMRGAPALPNAIGRLTRLARGVPHRMVLRLRPDSPAPQVLADLVIADDQGRALLLIEGLESTSDAGLSRFGGWTGTILDDITDSPSAQAAE